MILRLALACLLCLPLSGCLDANPSKSAASGLSGLWRASDDNKIYTVLESGTEVKIRGCDNNFHTILAHEGDYLTINDAPVYEVVDEDHLTYAGSTGSDFELVRYSTNPGFRSGTLIVESANITDVSATSQVCAYRQDDGVTNIIAAPYSNNFITLTLEVFDETVTDLALHTSVSIRLESDDLAAQVIEARSGTINYDTYSNSRIKASFTFYDGTGNEYNGRLDVAL